MTEPREKCIICDGIIYRNKNYIKTNKNRRGDNQVTCRRNCAKIFNRVSDYVRRRIERRLKKQYEIKKEI